MSTTIINNYVGGEPLESIMTRLDELAAQQTDILNKLNEGHAEILDKITDLEDQLLNIELPADAEATLELLKEKAQALADIVPGSPADEFPPLPEE
jgi:hypothetical protein